MWLTSCGTPKKPAQPAQVYPAVAEMNDLVKDIHADLLKLRGKHPWLAEYGDKCLLARDGRLSIWYEHGGGLTTAAAQPFAGVVVLYGPIDVPRKGKRGNSFADEAVCQFPELSCTLHGQVSCRDKEREAINKAVWEIVLVNCRKAREELNKRKQP
jgi:hypothetical protein